MGSTGDPTQAVFQRALELLYSKDADSEAALKDLLIQSAPPQLRRTIPGKHSALHPWSLPARIVGLCSANLGSVVFLALTIFDQAGVLIDGCERQEVLIDYVVAWNFLISAALQ